MGLIESLIWIPDKISLWVTTYTFFITSVEPIVPCNWQPCYTKDVQQAHRTPNIMCVTYCAVAAAAHSTVPQAVNRARGVSVATPTNPPCPEDFLQKSSRFHSKSPASGKALRLVL
ncbi:hypothetical protein PPACK8108_LOCUS24011 [Phakopsora pachyrhizi]|uniref:Uncharacterized protein n=1 Tax=Phakopsora pachyrhizi TaxID=170000 RepID=A0AAV0BRY4_PHAPC|nr:hypothetical protein PPACK8108_LOCUS24011 [Phakopsora pachyrhizi]